LACIGRGFSLEFARPRYGRGAAGTLRCGGLYSDGCGLLRLRWFRDPRRPGRSGRDHGISPAIAYRCLDDVITVLADEAPGMHQALALREQMSVRSFIGPFVPVSAPPRGCMMCLPERLCDAPAGQAGRVRGHVQCRGGDGRATRGQECTPSPAGLC
jgi:hypothetical protein